MQRQQQQGVALITMMLIVALVSALLYQMVSQHQLTIARSQQSLGSSRSLAMALGAEAYARQILVGSWVESGSPRFDHLEQPWAQAPAPFEVEGGYLEFAIVDLHANFNLNALHSLESPQHLTQLQRLLTALGLEPRIAELWKDWVDPDDEVTGFGAEDSQYLIQEPPYRAANNLAADISELRLLHEVDQAQIDQLLPAVGLLPTATQALNVNTASALSLHAVAPQLSLAQAQALTDRPRAWADVASAVAEVPELNGAQEFLVVQSEFFRIEARAEIDGFRTDLVSIVHRNPETGTILLLSRDFGKRYSSRVQPAS